MIQNVHASGLEVAADRIPLTSPATVDTEAAPKLSESIDETDTTATFVMAAGVSPPPLPQTTSSGLDVLGAAGPVQDSFGSNAPGAEPAPTPEPSPTGFVSNGGDGTLGNVASEDVSRPLDATENHGELSKPSTLPDRAQPQGIATDLDASLRVPADHEGSASGKFGWLDGTTRRGLDLAEEKLVRSIGDQNRLPAEQERIDEAAKKHPLEPGTGLRIRTDPVTALTDEAIPFGHGLDATDAIDELARGVKLTARRAPNDDTFARPGQTPAMPAMALEARETRIIAAEATLAPISQSAHAEVSANSVVQAGHAPKIESIKVVESSTLPPAANVGSTNFSMVLFATEQVHPEPAANGAADGPDRTAPPAAAVYIHNPSQALAVPEGKPLDVTDNRDDSDPAPPGISPDRMETLPRHLGPVIASVQAHAAATIPHEIHTRLAELARHHAGQTIEIALSPEELGRIRMSFSTQDGGLAVTIQADRPDTLDLMRRNIESLAADFRDLGFQDLSFAFGRDQSANPSPDQSDTEFTDGSGRAETTTPDVPPVHTLAGMADVAADNRLDLRL
ncbi:MAG: flagellar hook-length control protein FliK [Rhodobacteraceae bacterium]|nr:flagellar hook-length control protein FliK [Paracoccaceae bacterium]